MAKISSTPCIGRSFVSMEDEKTCDVWSTSSEMDHNTSEPALAPKHQFQIFSDEEPLVSAPKFEIFVDKTEEVPKLPTRIPCLQIFSDEEMESWRCT